MWWCLIFDFTFSIFARFCFCFFSSLSFLRFCAAPHYVLFVNHLCFRFAWLMPKNNSFFLLLLPFTFAVFSCLSHANLNRDPNSDEHIIDTNWTSIDAIPGRGKQGQRGRCSTQLDVRNWPPWSFGSVFRSSGYQRSLSLSLSRSAPHSFLVNEEIEMPVPCRHCKVLSKWALAKCPRLRVSVLANARRDEWKSLQKVVHCLFSWGRKTGKTKPTFNTVKSYTCCAKNGSGHLKEIAKRTLSTLLIDQIIRLRSVTLH